jgi:hypothetical protein
MLPSRIMYLLFPLIPGNPNIGYSNPGNLVYLIWLKHNQFDLNMNDT